MQTRVLAVLTKVVIFHISYMIMLLYYLMPLTLLSTPFPIHHLQSFFWLRWNSDKQAAIEGNPGAYMSKLPNFDEFIDWVTVSFACSP
jgi:hypothetical protein